MEIPEMYQVTQMVERQIYGLPGEVITAYDFITMKPLGRSPQGLLIPANVALAFESGIVKVFDVNLASHVLFEIVLGKEII
jgi:hypothetical protein